MGPGAGRRAVRALRPGPRLMGVLVFVLLALATFRVTRLVTDDRVLAVPVLAVQVWCEARWTRTHPDAPAGDPDRWQSPLAYVLACPWCLGLWVAAALTAATAATVGIADPWLVAPAASAVTGLLASVEAVLGREPAIPVVAEPAAMRAIR